MVKKAFLYETVGLLAISNLKSPLQRVEIACVLSEHVLYHWFIVSPNVTPNRNKHYFNYVLLTGGGSSNKDMIARWRRQVEVHKKGSSICLFPRLIIITVLEASGQQVKNKGLILVTPLTVKRMRHCKVVKAMRGFI